MMKASNKILPGELKAPSDDTLTSNRSRRHRSAIIYYGLQKPDSQENGQKSLGTAVNAVSAKAGRDICITLRTSRATTVPAKADTTEGSLQPGAPILDR